MPLPEPSNHFTLEEISNRWECDKDKIIQYCMNNMLDISVLLTGQRGYQIKIDENGENYRDVTALYGVYVIPNYHVQQIYKGKEVEVSEVFLPHHDSKTHVVLFHDACEILETNAFTSEDLIISKAERDRFENKHGMNSETSTNKIDLPDKPLDPREKTSWAQIVKILCLENKIPLDSPYKAAEIIQQIAASHGVKAPKKKDTIAKRLGELPED